MAEEQPPDEGSAEALREALKSVPCDKAFEAAPDTHERFQEFARVVYPHVPTSTKQYREMEMIWHAAYLDFLEILIQIVAVQTEEVGSDIIQVIKNQAISFLEDYSNRRGLKKEGENEPIQ